MTSEYDFKDSVVQRRMQLPLTPHAFSILIHLGSELGDRGHPDVTYVPATGQLCSVSAREAWLQAFETMTREPGLSFPCLPRRTHSTIQKKAELECKNTWVLISTNPLTRLNKSFNLGKLQFPHQ